MPTKINIKGPIIADAHQWIYNWLRMPATSPSVVSKGLKEAAGGDVELEIASNGGMVTSAIEIYQMLKDYDGKVTARIAYACSAATVISCAADESEISEVGFFMIHNAQSYAEGDKRAMDHEKAVLATIDGGIITAYEKKTGKSRESIQSLMNRDTYMSATEAVEYGFVDGLIPDTQAAEGDASEIVEKAVAAAGGMIPQEAIADLGCISKYLKEITGMDLMDLKKEAGKSDKYMNEAGIDTIQISGNNAGSDNSPEKGDKTMGLQELLAEYPEISNEIEEMTATARAEGVAEGIAQGVEQERTRMKGLDAIANRVSKEMLAEAKYGEEPVDGPTLAFKAMQEDAKLGESYLANAQTDLDESGTAEVGTGEIHAGEEDEETETAEAMAAHVNQRKEGRQS